MKHSAPTTFDTECSVHDMSYVRYCSLTIKKSVSETEKKKSLISQSFHSFGNMAWNVPSQWQSQFQMNWARYFLCSSLNFSVFLVSGKNKKTHEPVFTFTNFLITQTFVSPKTTFLFTVNMLEQFIKYFHRISKILCGEKNNTSNIYNFFKQL